MRLKTKIRAGKIRKNCCSHNMPAIAGEPNNKSSSDSSAGRVVRSFNVLRERMEGETDRLNGITTQ